MKNNAYRNSKLKKQLEARRKNGCKKVIWSLKTEQKEFVEKFYRVEEYLYKVQTKYFKNLKGLDPILRTLHYKKKQGKDYIIYRPKHGELKLFDDNGVKYHSIKYEIHLIE